MKKIFYNVNINDTRVEQFETLEQAYEYAKSKHTIPFLTKSVYETVEDSDISEEISEHNIHQDLSKENVTEEKQVAEEDLVNKAIDTISHFGAIYQMSDTELLREVLDNMSTYELLRLGDVFNNKIAYYGKDNEE